MVVVALLTFLAFDCAAATIVVDRSGAGDFRVLQEGIDAAAEGDTVFIRAGRYTESSIAYISPVDTTYSCAHIELQRLTVIGEGAETIIGPTSYVYPDTLHEGITCHVDSAHIEVSNLTLVNCKAGIELQVNTARVVSASIEQCDIAILVLENTGVEVLDCILDGNDDGIVNYRGSVLMERTHVVGRWSAITMGNGGTSVVRDCVVRLDDVGTGVTAGAAGVVEILNVDISAGLGVAALSLAQVTLRNSRVQGTYSAVRVTNASLDATAGNNVLVGGSGAVLEFEAALEVDVNDNDLQKGEGILVRARQVQGDLIEPTRLNLRNNFWGLTNAVEIAELIDDFHDYPPPPYDDRHYVIVDFEPFLNESTPTEQKSLSGLKGLFR